MQLRDLTLPATAYRKPASAAKAHPYCARSRKLQMCRGWRFHILHNSLWTPARCGVQACTNYGRRYTHFASRHTARPRCIPGSRQPFSRPAWLRRSTQAEPCCQALCGRLSSWAKSSTLIDQSQHELNVSPRLLEAFGNRSPSSSLAVYGVSLAIDNEAVTRSEIPPRKQTYLLPSVSGASCHSSILRHYQCPPDRE
jgi:hypothetical protein